MAEPEEQLANHAKLKAWSTGRGIKSAALGVILNVTPARISRILTGSVAPNEQEISRIDRLTAGHVSASGWK